jgi:hypothetical protein
MPQIDPSLSTGLRGFDKVLRGLIPGDNIVFQVGDIDDYRPFIGPYARAGQRLGRRVTYFRFAGHEPLLSGSAAEIRRLDPSEGFEPFTTAVHEGIAETGKGGFFVFDDLTELAEAWYSDQMLGNFFMLTCPYLYDVEALAYFAFRRNRCSFLATGAILNTCQVLLDVYRHRDELYIHPWKVQARYSSNMHNLHVRRGEEDFQPVTDSATIAEIRTAVPFSRLESGEQGLGVWEEAFARAERRLAEGGDDPPADEPLKEQLLNLAITREGRMYSLARRYFTLADLLAVGRRVVGTGLIGGKSVGMLLARAILRTDAPHLAEDLEAHDSFYIGSDVFYTFLVRNGLWWLRENQKDPRRFLEGALRGRHRILMGEFPEHILRQFTDLLDYFGQSPIIVRSSSLLEDNFGNAFAGKYESVFLANQGPRSRRLDDFLSAVRTIYASAMGEEALTYRHHRGLLDKDEQMALLVQRVSGAAYGSMYYPQAAGVGFSVNPYRWHPKIDPAAGMVRLVFGMGTRAVDRNDDDYTRVVALNEPRRRPEAGIEEVRRVSQRKVDVVDLQANQLVTAPLAEVLARREDLPLELFATADGSVSQAGSAREADRWVLTFEGLLEQTDFVERMRECLACLHDAYEHAVDVEFTANYRSAENCRINVVQCRPLQMQTDRPAGARPEVGEEDMLLRSGGPVLGRSRRTGIERLLYVVPERYAELSQQDRYALARAVGKVVRRLCEAGESDTPPRTALLGPGRWGTSTPSLGVPVEFMEISRATLLCEILPADTPAAEMSLGTHFFSDLVEADILYCALVRGRAENRLDEERLAAATGGLAEVLPGAERFEPVLRVLDAAALGADGLELYADSAGQQLWLYTR